MVRTHLCFLLWLGIFFNLCPTGFGSPPAEEESAFQAALALQQAMEVARQHLRAGDTKKAVDVLEELLPRANGSTAFLRLLREAYRCYIKDLRLANNPTQAKRYLDRLCILEPSAAQDPSLRPPETSGKATASEPRTSPLASLPKLLPNWALNHPKRETNPVPAKPPVVRAKVESGAPDDDPFAPANRRPDSPAAANRPEALALLNRAEEEFAQKRYAQARKLYESAYELDKSCLDNSRERWAYCMLDQVVSQFNEKGRGLSAVDLEHQVRTAIALAPKLEQEGKRILREIDQNYKTPLAAGGRPEDTAVEHLGQNKEGWQVAKTRHFFIFHNQTREHVEEVAAIAERTRRDMYRKWFGRDDVDWSPRCELILHATGADYCAMTGVPGSSPGHSRIEQDPSGQRVIGRRMDMRCDNPGMLETVLPHETTHIVLAGMFDRHHVPRWADEGIAVLTEPAYKVDQHRRNLDKSQQEGLLFGLSELMRAENYPEPRRIAAFYAQSVCVVEFMSELRGPQTFTAFVRDGLNIGYEAALQKHYGMNMTELQRRWDQHLAQGHRVVARP
jgi:tetratricopeptide (TPR) repeat protein